MGRNVQTDVILLEIANGLRELSKNPNLENSIKKAYALTQEEEKNLQEAKNILAQRDAHLAEVAAMKARYDDVEEKIALQLSIEEQNATALKLIEKKTRENESLILAAKKLKDEANSAIEIANAKNLELSEKEARLNNRESEIGKKQSAIDAAASEILNKVQGLQA